MKRWRMMTLGVALIILLSGCDTLFGFRAETFIVSISESGVIWSDDLGYYGHFIRDSRIDATNNAYLIELQGSDRWWNIDTYGVPGDELFMISVKDGELFFWARNSKAGKLLRFTAIPR